MQDIFSGYVHSTSKGPAQMWNTQMKGICNGCHRKVNVIIICMNIVHDWPAWNFLSLDFPTPGSMMSTKFMTELNSVTAVEKLYPPS